MSQRLGFAALGLVLPVLMLGADSPGASKEKQQPLAGQFEITGGQKDGLPIPAERLKGSTVVITGNTVAVVDGEKKELYSAKFKLTERAGEKGVWDIDMESKVPKPGAKAVGLIKLKDEEAWLIYGLNDVRPKNFDKTTTGQHLFHLKRRAKPAGEKSAL